MIPGDSAIVAVARFLVTTLRRQWARSIADNFAMEDLKQVLLNDLAEIKEDLSILRGADKNVAIVRFVRGVDLMVRQSLRRSTGQAVGANNNNDDDDDKIWQEDLTAALDSAENAYHRVKSTAEKIMCFEIICSCFLLLRPTESAMYSILNSLKILMREKPIVTALTRLRNAVKNTATLKVEECVLLELFLSRVCAILSGCERMDKFTSEHREAFRKIFRENEAIREAVNPATFFRWGEVQVFKHTTKRRVLETTVHVIMPVVPTMSATATIMTAGMYRPKNAGIKTFDKILLKDRQIHNQGGTLFDFRWSMLDLAHCDTDGSYRLGSVSLTLESSSSSWKVTSVPDKSLKKIERGSSSDTLSTASIRMDAEHQ